MKFKKLASAKLIIGLLAFGLAGCSITPDTISTENVGELVEFDQVIGTEAVDSGKIARWGGEIVSVDNLKDYSEIEILHYPTNHYGKPMNSKNSEGRFKVKVKGFVDPLVFEKGRLITVVGELSEPKSDLIGEQEYLYPVVAAEGYHMWKKVQEVEVSPFYFNRFGLGWGSHYFTHYRHPPLHLRGLYSDTRRITLKDTRSGQFITSSRSDRLADNTRSTGQRSTEVQSKIDSIKNNR